MSENIINQIEKVWEYEQRILDVFNDVCKSHHLKYSLAYGTLLGAVRHKGFIPWDDDIDVMMSREDYNNLIKIWNAVAPKDYILVNHEKYPDFTQSYGKIVLNNTTFLEYEESKYSKYPKGFFLDIFPYDRVAAKPFQRKKQFVAAFLMRLFTRDSTSTNTKSLRRLLEKVLLCLPAKIKINLKHNTSKYVQKWNACNTLKMFCPLSYNGCKLYFPSGLLDNIVDIEFNGKTYCSTSQWKEYLTVCYGDYMRLPPKEQQVWSHHPILIDFEHNYENLSE